MVPIGRPGHDAGTRRLIPIGHANVLQRETVPILNIHNMNQITITRAKESQILREFYISVQRF